MRFVERFSGASLFELKVSANPMIGDVAVERAHFLAALAWCRDEFGPEGSVLHDARWSWSPRDERNFGQYIPAISIRSADDRFAFKLRWC